MADTPNPPKSELTQLIKAAELRALDVQEAKEAFATAVHDVCSYLSSHGERIPHGLSADLHKQLVRAGVQ